MEVLVTGGTGYIGSHTVVELLNKGHKVLIADNLSNSSKTVINRIEEITENQVTPYFIDLVNKEDLDQVFKQNKIDAVIHFAGYKAVGESVEKPLKYYKNNLESTLNLCEVMENNGVYNLIFSSSATVYGKPDSFPIKESFSTKAYNPYGRSKLMIEEILTDLSSSNDKWNISLLRYFNPVGAHKSGKIGEDPNGIPNNLMPYITQVAVGKLKELKIFGDNYNTIDGTGVRDYIHVVDLAKGHLKAIEKIDANNGMEIYNLGTGHGYSVKQVIDAFEKASGKQIKYSIVDRRPGDISTSYADSSKAFNQLGWKAEKDIHDMCRDAWNWQEMNPNGYE
ncbi:UDP-glucose 4-epimerase [Virgibacillus subterraneus]|uniref:UDP-glucose 4-epimerase n=1 Tax=Virgibacillus subterraneus TaxID=621109 RepID=A0A1H9AFM5_9BACI|nr:UDP-glucose 4-epimerase GalE [Virgibacillus subterraneus]SEP75459.1 UDP-glucose 4-epimerase [Virgibacillus subterraneus]